MVRVGLSGWSHPDWVGPFYPVGLRDAPEAWLDHYASRFRTVEIASTFDALPDETLVAAWAREGVALAEREGDFEYSLKLPRLVTHAALPSGDRALARAVTGRFDREVLDPLAGEEILGAVLVQLPPTLEADEDAVVALQDVLDALVERRVAIEFRHPSWIEGECIVPLAEPLFANPDVTLAEVDLPHVPQILPPVDADHAYLRFHGRRADAWAGDAGPDGEPLHDGARYDYLYAADELSPWVERVRLLQRQGKDVRVYFNNTPGAKGVVNALDFLSLVGQAPDVPRPRLTEQTRLSL